MLLLIFKTNYLLKINKKRSPVGVPETTPQLFGNSWKTSSSCSPGYDSTSIDPCDVHLQAGEYVYGEE